MFVIVFTPYGIVYGFIFENSVFTFIIGFYFTLCNIKGQNNCQGHSRKSNLIRTFTDHVRRTREGNVFSRVCDSVHRGERACQQAEGSVVWVDQQSRGVNRWGWVDSPGASTVLGWINSPAGWPRHRENWENREFECSFFQTGKTGNLAKNIVLHREFISNTGKILKL